MIIYETPPVDFFAGLMPLTDYIKNTNSEENNGLCISSLFKLAMYCARAVAIAKGNTWEGDIRGEDLYVLAIPDPDASPPRLGLIWKQDNNGTTFICSHVEIPWISEYKLA